MSITSFKGVPYVIDWGSGIYAKISAINVVGNSDFSDEGNGAVILTIPDPPSDLSNNDAITSSSQIGLSWSAASDGGTPILDYTVSM